MTLATHQVETIQLMEDNRVAIGIQADRNGHTFIFAGGCCWQVGKVNLASNIIIMLYWPHFAWESWPLKWFGEGIYRLFEMKWKRHESSRADECYWPT